jgi:hypothetical protein
MPLDWPTVDNKMQAPDHPSPDASPLPPQHRRSRQARHANGLAGTKRSLTAPDKQLNNDTFMSKAPAHIVDGLRQQHAETKILYDKTKSALDALPLS